MVHPDYRAFRPYAEESMGMKRISEATRVVVDTNIFFGGLFPSRSHPRKIVRALLEGAFTAILSDRTFRELSRTLGVMKGPRFRRARIYSPQKVLDYLKEHAIWVSDAKLDSPVCADPDDDKFFAAAVEGRADYLVSNDKLVLRVGDYRGVTVLSARRFADLLAERPPHQKKD